MILFCNLVGAIAVFMLYPPQVPGHFSNETTDAAKESLLLQLFGLTPALAPDLKPASPPDYMTELFHRVSDEHGSVIHPNAIQGNHIHSFLERDGGNRSILFFNVSSIRHSKEKILLVNLVLFKVHSSSKYKFPKPFLVVVEIIDVSTSSTVSVKLVPSKIGWYKFPINLRLVENWRQNRSANVSLMVRVRQLAVRHDGKTRRPHSLRFARGEGMGRMKSKQPMLVVYCDDPSLGTKPRVNTISTGGQSGLRRSERATDRNSNSACRRRKMLVDFKELGWDSWVIAPPFYSAFRCAGRCSKPINSWQTPSTHALIQADMASQPGSDIDEPCCHPMQYSAISLLYFDTRDVKSMVLKVMPKMVVEKCACF